MMNTVKYYETVSFGGMELRDKETTQFDSIEKAINHAHNDKWNCCYTLYEITITVGSGKVFNNRKKLGDVLCHRDIERLAYLRKLNIECEKEITKQLNNKRIKETTREKRVEHEKNCITWHNQEIAMIESKM